MTRLNVNGSQSLFFFKQFLNKTLLAVDPGLQNSSTEVTLLYIHISVILMVQTSMPITICHSAMALCKHVFKNFNFAVSLDVLQSTLNIVKVSDFLGSTLDTNILLYNQKYSRLRCLLHVKGLVICFYLG